MCNLFFSFLGPGGYGDGCKKGDRNISSNLFDCILCVGIFCVGSGSGGIELGWVGMVRVVMLRYWWPYDGDGGDDGCCNSGSCESELFNFFKIAIGSIFGV